MRHRSPASQDPDRDLRDFSAYVFTDAQDRWIKAFREEGKPYERAKPCSTATASPRRLRQRVLRRRALLLPGRPARLPRPLLLPRHGAPAARAGDFAWAYVIAHEVGHHVQRPRDAARSTAPRARPDDRNELSVRQELQADCYAGVWAHEVFKAGQLEEGDIEEAFRASEAVGDDRLQKNAGQRVNPDVFTHGTSAQRRKWFDEGPRRGTPAPATRSAWTRSEHTPTGAALQRLAQRKRPAAEAEARLVETRDDAARPVPVGDRDRCTASRPQRSAASTSSSTASLPRWLGDGDGVDHQAASPRSRCSATARRSRDHQPRADQPATSASASDDQREVGVGPHRLDPRLEPVDQPVLVGNLEVLGLTST